MIIYKGISKAEFCEDANISPSKLREWLKANMEELKKFGVQERTKVLPPGAVRLLAEKYQVFPRNAQIMGV